MSHVIRIAVAVLALGTLAACRTINHVPPPRQAKKVIAQPPGQAKKVGGY